MILNDGTRASWDALSGADGIHSVVRGIIDPDYTGLTVPPGTMTALLSRGVET